MLCDKCGKQEATVKFVQIENNKKTELHLCRDCAHGYPGFSTGFDLQHLLSSLFQSVGLGQAVAPTVTMKTCPTCGRSIADIQKTGRLGCGSCYEAFREELNPVLETARQEPQEKSRPGPFPRCVRPARWRNCAGV